MPSTGLTINDFTRVGVRGGTDPRNSYAHAMAFFKGRLYVGAFRDSLCLMKRPNRKIPPPKMDYWPVRCPDPEVPELMRGQIPCYDPECEQWHVAYQAPMIDLDGERAMRDVGYRGMLVHQGASDSEPCLYAGSLSATGCRIMRSVDGVNFEATCILEGPSVRTLASFNGKLYTAILGQTGAHGNESYYREVWESDDPASGHWYPVSEPGFGDEGNVSIFDILEFDGHLYAATMNYASGFQLWKTDGEGKPPYRWRKVITAGAYRGFLNEFGMSMAVHNGCLYVGTGIAGGGYDRIRKVGPAAAELLRVYPDDTWDLVVGAPRITPEGIKVPISGMGPGFDNFLNGYTWRLCEHNGHLYAGTFNGAAFIKYRPHALGQLDPDQMDLYQKLLPTGDLDRFTEQYGGAHLWRTADGERFEPVTRNGFGSAFNMGVRQMVSTPFGLFVGTANSFGPYVGVQRDGSWQYEPNPRGGMEIWLGTPSEPVPRTTRTETRSRDRQYRHALLRTARQIEQQIHTVLLGDFYGHSGLSHIGYWKDSPESARQACEAMIDELAGRLGDTAGPILDVGCGFGGTTGRLSKHIRKRDLIGVEESTWILDAARNKMPELTFVGMNPTRLDYEDNSIGAIICAESAAYFDTRQSFLEEAGRVLRPGGQLVMADLLFTHEAIVANRGRYRSNYVKNLADYRKQFIRAGFDTDIDIADVTEYCGGPFLEKLSAEMTAKFRSGELTEGQFSAAMACASRRILFVRHYVFVSARKPLADD